MRDRCAVTHFVNNRVPSQHRKAARPRSARKRLVERGNLVLAEHEVSGRGVFARVQGIRGFWNCEQVRFAGQETQGDLPRRRIMLFRADRGRAACRCCDGTRLLAKCGQREPIAHIRFLFSGLAGSGRLSFFDRSPDSINLPRVQLDPATRRSRQAGSRCSAFA